MSTEAESETYKGHSISIRYDEDALNPRTEWDNLTEIHVLNGGRYYLGEHTHDREELDAEVAQAKRNGDMVFPLYAYIHSGTALSLESFHGKLPQGHAEFDSGQCGVVIVRRNVMLENFGGKKWTKELRQKAYDNAKSDIDTFNKYLNGEVYGYIIDDGEGDSCWGFYSIEDALEEAKGSIDWVVKQETKSHFEQLKTWIKNKVPFQYRTSLDQHLTMV